jgi:hypothetical protein
MMLSEKLQRAIEKAEANLSPVSVDSEHYIVGAFDYYGNSISLMTTMSKVIAERQVGFYKKNEDVHTIVVERPGVGMKVWIGMENGGWRTREVRASQSIREAIAGLRIAEVVRNQKGPRWEPPRGDRKFWRREKSDGGYEYRETPPEGQQKPKERPPEQSKGQQKSKVYKTHVRLTKLDLKKTLSHGHFSVISAGRNPDDSKESKMKPDDEFFHKRHEQLRDELEKRGLRHTEVVGHYGGKETSFLVFHDDTELTPKTQKSVIVHHHNAEELNKNRKVIEELGKKFNQNSVLHGNGGKNKLVFTAGDKAGQECGGKGWKEMPEAKDYYTDIKLEGKEHTKFNLDIAECFEKGFL